MAIELRLVKNHDGTFGPFMEEDAELIKKVAVGKVLHSEWKELRNSAFHKKYFSMLKFAFDHWNPKDVYGINIQKNFDVFREQVTIRAGYYVQVFDLDGNFQLHAKSIAFGRMTQDEFEKLYSATIDVILSDVFTGCDDDVVMQLLQYDG